MSFIKSCENLVQSTMDVEKFTILEHLNAMILQTAAVRQLFTWY
jgi:hypothetical protein